MKVQFTCSIAGEEFSYRPNEIADVKEDLAKKFLASGVCVLPTPGSFSVTCPGCGNQFESNAPKPAVALAADPKTAAPAADPKPAATPAAEPKPATPKAK